MPHSQLENQQESHKALLLQEFESDIRSEAEAELERLLLETEQHVKPTISYLITNLKANRGWFPVSAVSCYRDDIWHLDHPVYSLPIQISFTSEVENGTNLKRALCFYMLPDHALLGGIKSNKTTLTYSQSFKQLEQYLFKEKHLSAKKHHLQKINSRTINSALDKAKEHSAKHYYQLFKIIKLWILLSDQKLIPSDLAIDVPLESVVTPERKEDISSNLTNELQKWTSFSEDDLCHLMEYSLFWLEKVAPELVRLEAPIAKINKKIKSRLLRSERDAELEESFEVCIDGKIIMSLNCQEGLRSNGQPVYCYTYKQNFADVINHIRNSVFVMLALVTGARVSELAPLSATDITNDKADGSGDYWIRIVRWKTADDPTYNGEVEFLPLPRFVAESTLLFIKLSNFGRVAPRHWLFETNRVGATKKTVTPLIVVAIINQLSEELPIERLHAHRFRKTIAEILIHRDERNLDLIRALFGHKTFKMTMQYIARNPALVRCVAAAIEVSYSEELHDIITQIKYGAYSGLVAKRIANEINQKPMDFPFRGNELRITLIDFVTNLLEGGEPLFIKRTAVGTYCITAEHFEPENYPPCIQGRVFQDEAARPDPSNCHYDCRKIVVLEKARGALEGNIKFYQRIIDRSSEGRAEIPEKTLRELQRKVDAYRNHLDNLDATSIDHYNPELKKNVIFKQASTGRTINMQEN